ncbi:Sugar/inositol transporter [Cordyceps fumosorosea ARSEF 2679]|uniref:Sugar/inositol transporter n=1 Tax=Cordyceps fumosorosea (strain ARSEF 2679) TaxID=1081104 RepID=A0A167S5U1_CORFA|nr:Sugar/inositol transporter [Cordyceps fumosorosea ARSEF 2679]OAA59286.1 Sugar/inositol transporter [Cordyceps fumosorosea ARSEF 2679]
MSTGTHLPRDTSQGAGRDSGRGIAVTAPVEALDIEQVTISSTSHRRHASSSSPPEAEPEAGFLKSEPSPINFNANIEAKYVNTRPTLLPPNVPSKNPPADLHAPSRIKNPLVGIPRQTLLRDVDEFCRAKGLKEHRALFRKGALIAQDPTGYEDITGDEAPTPAEVDALRNEVLHKWRVPRMLLLTIATCSIGAAVQGWDQTGSNGANLQLPRALGIGSDSTADQLRVGLVNAGPYIGTALVGCWLSDPVNYFLGRRGCIFLAANFCLWPVLASAFCRTWQQLVVCRLLMGVGMGAKASTVPIYAAEIAPAPIRGALLVSWQLWTAFGIFIGTCANLVGDRVGRDAWRYQLGAAFIPAVPLAVLIYMCPESPRWYMKKNRYPDAFRSMLLLRKDPVQAARDLYYIHAQLQAEHLFIGSTHYVKRFIELFTIPRVRRATLAASTTMLAQQMCGINIIAFYSSSVFEHAGASSFQALLATWGFGLINFLFAFPSIWTIDTFGRRSLLLFTFPQMSWTLLTAGLCTLISGNRGAHLGVVALFVYLFAAFYSPGCGPVPYAYSSEIFSRGHREMGMAFAVATCLFWAAVLSITLPLMLRSLGVMGVFGFYSGLNVVALIMIFLWVPETKQRTLEEIDYIFAVPTRVFMRYQVTRTLPWWFRRYLMRDKSAILEPLFQLELEDHHAADGAFDNDKARVELKEMVGFTKGIDPRNGEVSSETSDIVH